MSTNQEQLTRAYEAFAAGDVETAFADLHDDCVLHEGSELVPAGGDYHGKQEIMGRWLPELAANYEGLRLTIDEMVGDGDTVCVLGTARSKVAGKDIKSPFCHVWHYEGGKVVDARFLHSQVEIYAAVQEREKAASA